MSAVYTPKQLLARLTRLTSTIPGLDASLMLAQYSSPIVIALILKLAAFRAKHPRLHFSHGSGKGTLTVDGGFGLVKLAEGWGRAAGSIGDARVIMRAFGMLPIIQWLLSLHPRPLRALRTLLLSGNLSKTLNSAKTLPTMQVLAILLYYPLEHISWLASKGVVPLSPAKLTAASQWSVRFWALYVILEICKLRGTYLDLSGRTRALENAKPEVTATEAEGFELEDEKKLAETEGSSKSETKADSKELDLEKDWKNFKTQALINSGYAPLTVHWSTPGGLWSSPLITGVLGSTAAIGSLLAQWRKGDLA